jgi:hypothetical protein
MSGWDGFGGGRICMEVDSVGDSEGGGGETRFLVHGKAVIS